MERSETGEIASASQPAPAGARAPGPTGRRLLGSLFEVRNDRLRFVSRSTAEYGDVVAFRMGPRRLFLLRHPRHFRHVLHERPERYEKGLGLRDALPLLGEGLLTSERALAARQRERLSAAFRAPALGRYAETMRDAALATAESWRRRGDASAPVDVARAMVVLTVEVLGRTLFRGGLSGRADEIHHDLVVFTRWAMARMTAVVPLPLAVPTPSNRRARRALGRLRALADELLARAATPSAAGDRVPDLVSLLLAPEAELPPSLVRDEILTFLLAGHDTTAATLSWAWHLLGEHPEVESRMHRELAEVLGGRPPELDDLSELVYTRAVLEETLRLFPPVWMIPRRTVAADMIDGYEVSRRSDVLLSVYSLHRHPRVWADPQRFDPERFLPPRRPPAGAFLPFGSGARTCLGSRFGTTQALVVLATLAQEFSLRAEPSFPVVPEASLTLRPRDGLWMAVRRRASARIQ